MPIPLLGWGKGCERDVLDTHPTLMTLSLQPALERAWLESLAMMHEYFHLRICS